MCLLKAANFTNGNNVHNKRTPILKTLTSKRVPLPLLESDTDSSQQKDQRRKRSIGDSSAAKPHFTKYKELLYNTLDTSSIQSYHENNGSTNISTTNQSSNHQKKYQKSLKIIKHNNQRRHAITIREQQRNRKRSRRKMLKILT